MNHLHFDRL
jgi:hypothetical protein